MKKKVLSVLLSLQMLTCATGFVLQPSINVSASTVQQASLVSSNDLFMNSIQETKNQQITSIFDEMADVRLQMELHPENQVTLDAKVAELESKLETLGVKELSDSEVAELQGNKVSAIAKRGFTTPSSTSSVKWYSNTSTVTYQGKKYVCKLAYAQGLDGSSQLARGRDGATLYSSKQVAVKNLKNIASIYAQKTIGLVPIVQWLPYELLFSDNTNVTNNSHVITYRSLETVCFAYVTPVATNSPGEYLTQISNSVKVASSHTLAGYKSGSPYSKTTDKTVTMSSPAYGNSNTAVANYVATGGRTGNDCIGEFKFYNYDKSKSLSQSICVPNFPGQVY